MSTEQMADQNLIAQKMEDMSQRWQTFVDDGEKVLLRWLFPVNDIELVNLFFRLQEEEYGDLQDLFFTFTSPFPDARPYARFLANELVAKYEEIKPILVDEELPTGWTLPEKKSIEDDFHWLTRVLATFQAYYNDIMNTLVVVLRPSQMGDVVEWRLWFTRLMQCSHTPEVRFLVLEYEESPILDGLPESTARRIYTDHLDLNLADTMEELARGDGSDTPENNFRQLFVKLSNQATKKDIDGAEQTAASALAIARAAGWLSMQVVVHHSLGAGYMQVDNKEKALATYRRATVIAREAKAAEDPAGPKMEVQCLFAEASVLFAMEKYEDASKTYQEAAPLAAAIDEKILAMEGWRMASYCAEVQDKFNESIRHGEQALIEGEKLPEEERAASTLAFVGDGLIRVHDKETAYAKRKYLDMYVKGDRTYPDAYAVNRKMKELLGDDWKDIVNNAVAEPAAESGAAP